LFCIGIVIPAVFIGIQCMLQIFKAEEYGIFTVNMLYLNAQINNL